MPAFKQLLAVKLVALVATGLVFTGSPADSAAIQGFVYDPHGGLASEIPLNANRIGPGNTNHQRRALSNAADPEGFFSMQNLVAGTYSLGVNPKDQWPRRFIFGLNHGASDTSATIILDADYLTGAYAHDNPFVNEYAQSFRALGTSVTSVSARFPTYIRAVVTIHQGGPGGPQVGPARMVDGSFSNDSHARWSAGDVPTVPGQVYTAKFREEFGGAISLQRGRVRSLNGLAVLDGKTYVDGQESVFPVRTIIGMDTDGVSTSFYTSGRVNFAGQSVNSSFGQVFKATGTSVVAANFRVGTFDRLEARIFEAPGPDGQGVNQIGPTKWIEPIAWNDDTMVLWEPGEVPVTPGNTYFLRVNKSSPGSFVVYRTINREYWYGSLYVDGNPTAWDLSGMVACEESPGSAARPTITFTKNPVAVNRSSSSATIQWSTSPPSAAILEYGIGSPYTETVSVPVAVENQSITLTNLQPGKEYHFRVIANTPGHNTRLSRDYSFVTEPITPNLLVNGGFESGSMAPWTPFGTGGIDVRNFPASGSGSFFNVKARSGNWLLGAATNGGQILGGIRQTVTVDPTKPVTFLAWLWTYQADRFNRELPLMVRGRIGIDPTGGTDPAASTVVWSMPTAGQNWFGTVHESLWHDFTLTVQPQSSQITVFAEAGVDLSVTWCVYGWDDLQVFQPVQDSVPLQHISDIRDLQDGTRVSIDGLVVTSSSVQTGGNYVQAIDRSAGIRVEGATPMTPFNVVNIEGTLATTPSGERMISQATYQVISTGVIPREINARPSEIGPFIAAGNGPGNLGLLMRTFGKVTDRGTGFIYVNDGSLPGKGLRVNMTRGGTLPNLGQFVRIRGVVTLEGTGQNVESVIRPRSTSDVVRF